MHKLTILHCHNYYLYKGGEEVQAETERKLLKENGHKVIPFDKRQGDYSRLALFIKFLFFSHFSIKTFFEVISISRKEKVDIIHVHNTHFLISPSIIFASWLLKKPLVMTLHNYRMIHPSTSLYFRSELLDKNLKKGKVFYFGKYFKDSYLLTARLCLNNWIYRKLIKLHKEGILLLCVSNVVKKFHAQSGIDSSILKIQHNCLNTLDLKNKESNEVYESAKKYLIFLGRLTEEKGIVRFLELYEQIKDEFPFEIVICGAGELENHITMYSKKNKWVKYYSFVDGIEKELLLKQAQAVISPSIYYETFGFTMLEGFRYSVPAVVSDYIATNGIVEDRVNGYVYEDNPESLRNCLKKLLDEDERKRIGKRAFENFRDNYTEEIGYKNLIEKYSELLCSKIE